MVPWRAESLRNDFIPEQIKAVTKNEANNVMILLQYYSCLITWYKTHRLW